MKYIPQKLYNQILKTMPISCVDVCIVHNGCILLVKRKDAPAKGEFWLPGGRVIKGEKLKDCAYRKAIEETGLDCYIGPIIHTDETVFEDGPNNIPIHSINVVFLLHIKTDIVDLKLDKHSTDYLWVNYNHRDLNKYIQKCLENVGLNYED